MSVADTQKNTQLHSLGYDGPCPVCGFHLKNPTYNNCPECGHELKLVIESPFRMTAWLVFLMGLIASIAICVNQICLLMVGVIMNGSNIPWRFLFPELSALLLLFVATAVWRLLFNWFARRSKATRVVTAFVGCMLPLAVFYVEVVFIVLLR